jgi:flagellar biosynthesis protein FliR
MNFSAEELMNYVASFIWPFFRVSAMFIALPVFGLKSIPVKLKILVILVITLVIFPTLPPIPVIDVMSFQGWMMLIQQILLGLSAGFILQMVFAVMAFVGQAIAYSMGLGFASMVDPATGVQVPVIAQLFVITSSLLFLGVDGHLMVIEMLSQSFHTLPVTALALEKADLWRIIIWSSQIFAYGVLLSLPVVATLLFVNISFGVASKAAPQLQLFGVGFPVTIIVGMVLVWMGMPMLVHEFSDRLHESFGLVGQLLRLN